MEEKWGGKKTETVITLAIAFYVVMVCVSIYTVGSIARQRPPQTEPVSRLAAEANIKIGTLNNTGGRQERLDEIVREGLITFSVSVTPSLQTGDSETSLLIENPSDNRTRPTVTAARDDTGEEIYQSGYLDPEQYIDKTPLDVVLSKGEYPRMASFNSYRIGDSSYLRRATAKITIYVLD